MKKFLKIFILLLHISSIHALDFSLDLSTGYRHDDLNWNISGGHSGPDVLSELKWEGLKSWEILSELKITLPPMNLYTRIRADYAKIFSGSATDEDFLGDNRTYPYSYSSSKADKGELFDLSAGVGFNFCFLLNRLKIAPLVGCSLREQHLRMYHGKMRLDLFNPEYEGTHLSNLHSNYRTRWVGPWVGIDINFNLTKHIDMYASYELHFARFDATGHWNLRSDFSDDFKHHGYGRGSLFLIGGHYCFCSGFNLGVLFKYQEMQIHKGNDRTYFWINEHLSLFDTRLNRVHWESYSLMATLGYSF